MRKWVLAVASAIVAAAPMHPIAAAPKKTIKRHAPKPPSATDMLIGGILANARRPDENLATACARVVPTALFAGLEPNVPLLNAGKGEFEATADFEARKANLDQILQSLGQIVACQALSDEDLGFAYDADTARFKLSESALRGFTIKTFSKKLASYRAKTRMGIPFTVYPWVEVDWKYSIAGTFVDRCLVGTYPKIMEVPVSLDRAPLLKATGRLVFLADLTGPYYTSEDDEPIPALDEPEVTSSRVMTVYLRAKRAVVIDSSGNEIWSCDAF